MIDGIKPFVTGLATAGPVLSAQTVLEFADRILEPRPPKKEPISHPVTAGPRTAREQEAPPAPAGQNVSRARAIFDASEQAKPFDPSDFEFALGTEPDLQALQASTRQANSETPLPASRKRTRRIFGMTPVQFVILAALALSLICILVVGIGYVIPLLT
jgi:hypothetical protein